MTDAFTYNRHSREGGNDEVVGFACCCTCLDLCHQLCKGNGNYQNTVYKKPSLRAKRGNPDASKHKGLFISWIATLRSQ